MRRLAIALAISTVTLSCSDTVTIDETADIQNSETVAFEEVLHLDWMAIDLGLITATDISPDLDVLRDVSWGIKFLTDTFSTWALESLNHNQNVDLPNCFEMDSEGNGNGNGNGNDKDEGEWNITILGCNIGPDGTLPLSGAGVIKIDGEEVKLEFELTTNTTFANVEWEIEMEWDDINEDAKEPDVEFSLVATYEGALAGRRFEITEGVAFPQEHEGDLPDFAFPDTSISKTTARTSWSGVDGTLNWGAYLDEDKLTYSGPIVAEYSNNNGSVTSISRGELVETTHDLSIVSSSSSTEGAGFVLESFAILWDLQNDSFTSEVSFSFDDSVMVFFPSWSTSVSISGYTAHPITLSGNSDSINATGSIEMSYSYTNNLFEEVTTWVNTQAESLTFASLGPLPTAGSVTARNVDDTNVEVFFQSGQVSSPWVLLRDSSADWVCRNLEDGGEIELSLEPEDYTTACSN